MSSNHNIINQVERSIAEIKRGKAIILKDSEANNYAVLPVENLEEEHLKEVQEISNNPGFIVLTEKRVKAILPEHSAHGPVKINLDQNYTIDDLYKLALSEKAHLEANDLIETGSVEESALQLVKLAELIPAAIIIPNIEQNNNFQVLESSHIDGYEEAIVSELKEVCDAPLKLKWADDASITVFRAWPSNKEHYAITVGKPDNDAPLVRIHSSCFTGDLLNSLRCDCRDQLHEAIKFMSENGGGVVLYLMQEGRGIGLANKLRAYKLQAEGFDTVDANEFLGFDDDERPYFIAAKMLKKIGLKAVSLLTNNPRKVKGLEEQGIEVKERVSLVIEPHEHNDAYLETKFNRLGHVSKNGG